MDQATGNLPENPAEQEIAELKRRDAELEQLSHTGDHIQFLQSCQSLCAPPGPGDMPSITVRPHTSFEALKASLSDQEDRLEDVPKVELIKLSGKDVLEPRTREDFLQHSCRLTLDRSTAHPLLRLSVGNREVTYVSDSPPHPDHPERDERWPRAPCREGLSGRSYWEAEWSGVRAGVAVSYKEISRKGEGDGSILEYDNKSWNLYCFPQWYCVRCDKESKNIHAPPSSRVGVYLDHRAGTLSFYSISDTMTLLHRVQTTFTRPLYPAFEVYRGSVKLCDLG